MQQRTDQLVLMTPDSESGKAVYPRAAQILAPIPLCFHSPANSPSPAPSSPSNMSSLEHVDVVQSLVEWQVPEVAKQILEYLSTEDLLSCLLVNSWWNCYISQDTALMNTISKYRSTLPRARSRSPLRVLWEAPPTSSLREKENLPKPLRGEARHEKFPPRTPLWPRWDAPSSSVGAMATPLSLIPRNIRVHSCPSCSSPAKELNLRRANCTKCGFDFCRDCLKGWHEVKCKGFVSESRNGHKQSCPINIAGDTRSKKRLRRL